MRPSEGSANVARHCLAMRCAWIGSAWLAATALASSVWLPKSNLYMGLVSSSTPAVQVRGRPRRSSPRFDTSWLAVLCGVDAGRELAESSSPSERRASNGALGVVPPRRARLRAVQRDGQVQQLCEHASCGGRLWIDWFVQAGSMGYLAESVTGRRGAWSAAFEGSCRPGQSKARMMKAKTEAEGRMGDVSTPLSVFLAVSVQSEGASIVVDEELSGGGLSEGGIDHPLVLRVTEQTGEESLVVIPATSEELWARAEAPLVAPPQVEADAFHPNTTGVRAHLPLWKLHKSVPLWSRLSRSGELENTHRAPAWARRTHVAGFHMSDPSELWRVEEQIEHLVKSSALQSGRQYMQGVKSSNWPAPGSSPVAPRIVPLLSNSMAPRSNLVIVQLLQPVCGVKAHASFVPLQSLGTAEVQTDQVVIPPSQEATTLVTEAFRAQGPSAVAKLVESWMLDAFWGRLAFRASAYDTRVQLLFPSHPEEEQAPPPRKHKRKATNERDPSKAAMVRFALGNLAGSVTLYRGRQLVRSLDGKSVEESEPYTLLTGCPSRSLFPRGFMWDEGFHQILLSKWDPPMSAAVLASWFSSMDPSGWIAREQILGEEARSRVPAEFRVQRRDVANPPTLLLAVKEMLRWLRDKDHMTAYQRYRVQESARWKREWSVLAENLRSDSLQSVPASLQGADEEASELDGTADADQWVERHMELIARYFGWLVSSQSQNGGAFSWRGDKPSDGEHTFASGLDDYPRGVVHTSSDAHVDLASWIVWGANLLRELAATYRGTTGAALEGVDELLAAGARAERQIEEHWNEQRGMYCDIGTLNATSGLVGHVCHEGYVSVFPLLLGLVPPDSPRLPRLLKLFREDGGFVSPFGLRSLSNTDPKYRSGDDYWRGKVWANINFLAFRALQDLARAAPDPSVSAECMAASLRVQHGISRAVATNWRQHGTLFENYDPDARGEGRGTHPFTGWTSLVAALVD
jgi:hypothetical protein